MHFNVFAKWQTFFNALNDKRSNSQFPQCICHIPQYTTLEQKCVHFCSKVVHCGIWDRCTVGFVKSILTTYFCLKQRTHIQLPEAFGPVSTRRQFWQILCWHLGQGAPRFKNHPNFSRHLVHELSGSSPGRITPLSLICLISWRSFLQ